MQLGNIVERGERGGDLSFGIFSRRLEWRDIAVAQACPIRITNFSKLAVKIDEPELCAECFGLFVGFMISRKDQKAVAERFEYFATPFQTFGEIGKVAIRDIDVGGLS